MKSLPLLCRQASENFMCKATIILSKNYDKDLIKDKENV